LATIKANKNKDGKIVSYRFRALVGTDEQGKQVRITTTIKRPEGLTPAKEKKEVERQADAWEKEQREAYENGGGVSDSGKITLKAFIEEHWWPDHVMDGTHTPSSIQFYKYMSDDILAYFGPVKKLRQINAESVKRYVKYMNTEAKTKAGKPYSKATTQHHFGTLRNILEYATRFEYIDKDPCKLLSAKEKPHRDKKQVDFLSPEQAKEYMRCLENEPIYWQALQNLLITTGLRRGEAVGLQWGDVSADGLTITVCRNVTMDMNASEKYHIGQTKGKDARVVPISRRVYGLLIAWKREQEARYGLAMPHAFVFCRADDLYTPLYPTEPTRWQRKFVRRNNLPDVSPHDLRHTAASLAIAGGADLKDVQELLGHKDASTTMEFYLGLTVEQQRRTVEGIEALLSNG
jgi:integrase